MEIGVMGNKKLINDCLFQIGDEVICIETSTNNVKGSGWSRDRKFIVSRIKTISSGRICLFGDTGSGVYLEFLELVKRHENQYEIY